ncbi:DUF2769 domain-containing protein [Candidatus Bathyarchaeota archaeon]|nr:DUF2769 domain-containing protein [Candidatus Bathyarchaeota archaeon]
MGNLGNLVPDSQENTKLCLCPGCPTFKKSNLSNNVFCARGKAAEKATTAGCMCPGCPVYKTYNLSQMYYCTKGKSAEI